MKKSQAKNLKYLLAGVAVVAVIAVGTWANSGTSFTGAIANLARTPSSNKTNPIIKEVVPLPFTITPYQGSVELTKSSTPQNVHVMVFDLKSIGYLPNDITHINGFSFHLDGITPSSSELCSITENIGAVFASTERASDMNFTVNKFVPNDPEANDWGNDPITLYPSSSPDSKIDSYDPHTITLVCRMPIPAGTSIKATLTGINYTKGIYKNYHQDLSVLGGVNYSASGISQKPVIVK